VRVPLLSCGRFYCAAQRECPDGWRHPRRM
jgi:hypothetical protein